MSERDSGRTATDGGDRREGDRQGHGHQRRRASGERQRTGRDRTGGKRRGRGGRRPEDRSRRRNTAPPGQDDSDRRDGVPPGDPGPGQRGGSGGDDDSGRIGLGRREFLLGGAGAAGLVAGGWWFFGRGYDGAKAVVADLYGALDSNDWGAVDQLMHEESRLAREIESRENVDSYEEYLEDLGGLERQAKTDYTVMGIHEMDRTTDPGEEVSGSELQDRDVTEFKEILAVVERDMSDWDGLGDDRDPVRVMDNRIRVALNGDGEWKLW